MPSELFGTSVIFVKVAPGDVERTLTTLRAKPNVTKAEAVFGRHDIAIAGGFRNTDELRAFASEVQLMDHVWAYRSYPALQDWTQKKADGHASNAYLLIRSNDTQKTMSELKKVPEIQEIIGTTGDSDIVARISADPREPPRVRRDEGPEHARRALDRDAPGVLEVLNQRLNGRTLEPVRPLLHQLCNPCFITAFLSWSTNTRCILRLTVHSPNQGDSNRGRPSNHMYGDRIRRGDGQEKEGGRQTKEGEDARPACGGPPKEDPSSRPVFRMVPGRRHEADHEHRRRRPGADRRTRDGQRRVRPTRRSRRPPIRSNFLLSGPAVRDPDLDHAGEVILRFRLRDRVARDWIRPLWEPLSR